MKYNKLLAEIEKEVTELFQRSSTALIYHTIHHTRSVVANAAKIARHYELSEKELFIVMTAAWFHDTGYVTDTSDDHEERSIGFAEAYLNKTGVDQSIIQQVTDCIMATKMPQQTKNLLEEIVCDADLFHFGAADFNEASKTLKKEKEINSAKKISKFDWKTGTLQVLEQHNYKTDYVQKLQKPGKLVNTQKVKNWLLENPLPAVDPQENEINEKRSAAIEKENSKRPERGIETMFRISSNNHQRLSDMADNKANIMITTTSIILSILLSVLLRKLEDNPHLIIPSFLLLASCLVTMIFSIKATRPVLPEGRFSRDDIAQKKTNLLFFGNFYRMNYQQYNEGMEAMMNDRSFLYGSLTLDVYSQGIVLGKKYRLLRIAYNVFMYGVSLSVIAFFLAVLIVMI